MTPLRKALPSILRRSRKSRIKWTVLLSILPLVLLFQASSVRAMQWNDLVVFGDSLSDTGNVFISSGLLFPPSPPYDNGRFSNGPVWAEVLASGLGLPVLTPSLLGGTNYAWGGAETGFGPSARGTPNIGEQINFYLGGGNIPSSDELFVMWAGANDFNNAPPGTDLSGLIPGIVNNISNHITTISSAAPGTELDFLVLNLPPLGQTPRVQFFSQLLGDPTLPFAFDSLSMIFNSVLSAELQSLETSPEINIFTLDIFSLSLQIFANPTTFGFTNTTDTARIGINPVSGGPPDVSTPGTDVVPNPEAYIFFDDIHPTTAWYSIVGNKAVEAVPETTTILLVGFGLMGLVGFRRKFKKK